jgi:hypothetical protein
MVYGTEKPSTQRSRIVTMAALWVIIGIPLTIGLWYLMSWWTLIPVGVVAWATIDYIRRGGSGFEEFYRGYHGLFTRKER